MSPQHRLAIEIMSECGMTPQAIHEDAGWQEDKPTFAEVVHVALRPAHQNRSTNMLITFNDVTKMISEWAEETGIDRRTISKRLHKLKWSVKDALTIPPARTGRGA